MTKQKSEKKTKSEKGRFGKKNIWNLFLEIMPGKMFFRGNFFFEIFFLKKFFLKNFCWRKNFEKKLLIFE